MPEGIIELIKEKIKQLEYQKMSGDWGPVYDDMLQFLDALLRYLKGLQEQIKHLDIAMNWLEKESASLRNEIKRLQGIV